MGEPFELAQLTLQAGELPTLVQNTAVKIKHRIKPFFIFNMRAKRYNLISKCLMVKLLVKSEGHRISLLTGEIFLKARISDNVSTSKNLNKNCM